MDGPSRSSASWAVDDVRPSPFPEDISERLAHAKVGIAGAGGMGSHVATALVRSGVGSVVIADFDRVDGSNLFRQCYLPADVGRLKVEALRDHLLEIEPDLTVEVHGAVVDPSNACPLFRGCDVVCECFDRPEEKAMLAETVISGSGIPVVSCSGMAGFGSSNSIVTERRMSRLYVCGDGVSDSSDGHGLTAARVMVCAGHAANMAIRLILGYEKP